MTFTEAAAHVLRLVGKPLHYKEITDVAIERDLLSHVGKSPEVTMGARLAAVVKKDPKDNPLVRVKPGVFALRDWDQSVIDSGLADRTPALERLAKLGVGAEEEVAVASEAAVSVSGATNPDLEDAEAESSAYPDLGGLDSDDDEDIGDDERARAELAAAANELFVPEDDDDEPILGGDADTETSERIEPGGKRRRRRRRRGGRSSQDEDNGLPSYTVSDAPLLTESDDEAAQSTRSDANHRRPAEPRSFDAGGRFANEAREGRSDGGRRSLDERNGETREPKAAEGRSGEGRSSEGRGAEGRNLEARGAEGRGAEGRNLEARGAEGRNLDGRGADAGRAVDDLSGPSVIALLEQLLSPRSRSGSIPIRQLAEQGVRKVRAKVEIQALQEAIADVVRGEIVRARSERRRPRFVMHGRAVSSTDWGLDPEVVRLEKEMQGLATRYKDAFARSFGERLQGLSPRAMGEFFTLLLSQMGFEDIQPVRRQGAHNQEMHFSAVARSATGEIPTAIIVRRDGRDIGRERVIDLRGALHHYADAQAGLLATTGQVMSGAREEARVPNAAPVNLLDGAAIARIAAQNGAGVVFQELRLPTVDAELFDSLTAS
ncbi:MAG TPA: HTH domain-containing protein [Polyangiaceae bacterium]|nr:HTH domain-containing protein [Polyangiaceae bacterium]